jgi:fructokinase
MSIQKSSFCCIGESLWDALPEGLFLGGAPLNVAVDLQALGQHVNLVSAVGDDVLGHLACKRLDERGLDISWMQNSTYQTGWVEVTLDQGVPSYIIHEQVAWDDLQLPEGGFPDCDILIHGSLALRSSKTAQTIQAAIEQTLSHGGQVVFDLNLRSPFDQPEIYEPFLYTCSTLKLNEDELRVVQNLLGVDVTGKSSLQKELEVIAKAIGCSQILCTQGAKGASLWEDGEFWQQDAEPVHAVDTVGAGDAFLAGFLAGLAKGLSVKDALKFATNLAGYVATQSGATPSLSHYKDILNEMSSTPTATR